MYWVLAANRVTQAETKTPEDAAFVLKLAQDLESAKMENAVIMVEVADWERLLRLVPNAQPLQPPTQSAMDAARKKLELKSPFVPRSNGAVVDVTPKADESDKPELN